MKFSLLTKLSAFALLATTTVAAEEPKNKLRGPVVVSTSDIESQAATDAKVSRTSGRRRSRSRPQAADKDLPEFFPSDMTEDQVAVFKETAAQKRQQKRDEARDIDNPDRGQDEENRERERKTEQSRSRGREEVDPYNGNGDDDDGEFGRKREAGRTARCDRTGRNCRYSTPNQQCYQDCTDYGYAPTSGYTCSEYCQYMDPECYDDCRQDGDGVVRCLDDCGITIDRNTGRAADRIDCADECLDDGPVGSNRYKKCFDNCDRDSTRGRASDRIDCADDFCSDKGRPGDRQFENCMDRNCRNNGDRTISGQVDCADDFCSGKGRPGDRQFENCMDRNCRNNGDRTISGQVDCADDFCSGKGRPGDRQFENCMDRNCRDAKKVSGDVDKDSTDE